MMPNYCIVIMDVDTGKTMSAECESVFLSSVKEGHLNNMFIGPTSRGLLLEQTKYINDSLQEMLVETNIQLEKQVNAMIEELRALPTSKTEVVMATTLQYMFNKFKADLFLSDPEGAQGFEPVTLDSDNPEIEALVIDFAEPTGDFWSLCELYMQNSNISPNIAENLRTFVTKFSEDYNNSLDKDRLS